MKRNRRRAFGFQVGVFNISIFKNGLGSMLDRCRMNNQRVVLMCSSYQQRSFISACTSPSIYELITLALKRNGKQVLEATLDHQRGVRIGGSMDAQSFSSCQRTTSVFSASLCIYQGLYILSTPIVHFRFSHQVNPDGFNPDSSSHPQRP
jgi:hypothetical protein